MRRFLFALSFLLCTALPALAQTAITLPIAANAVADLGNGPIKVRMIAGNASIFTAQGSGIGSTSGSSTALTLTATPATPPIVGGLISGAGITSGTTVAAYNGTTGITLSAAMTVPGGTTVSWGAACPSSVGSAPVIQASPQADYYIMYTQARVCAVSPGGPVNTLLVAPIFYDQTSQNGLAVLPTVQPGQALGNPTGSPTVPTGTFLDALFFGSGGNQFQVQPRPTITTFPVQTARPTTVNTRMASDLMPNGTATANAEGFITWHDDCDADLIANANAPVGCVRFGADTTLGYSAFGSVAYNGGTLRPLCLFYGIITNVVNCVATYATGWTFSGGTAAVNLNAAPIPSALLGGDVAFAVANADGTGSRIIAIATPGVSTDSPSFTGEYSPSLLSSPTAIVSGNNLVSFGGGGYNGAAWVFGRGSFQIYADANWSSTSEPTRAVIYTTPINAILQQPVLTAFNDGGIYIGTYGSNTPPTGSDRGQGQIISNLNAVNPTTLTIGNLSNGFNIIGLDGATAGHSATIFGNTGVNTFNRYDGTQASPTALLSGEEIGRLNFGGAASSSGAATGKARINCWAAENWGNTATGTYCSIFTTAKTTTTVQENFRFQDSGGLSVGNANITTNGGAGVVVATGFQSGVAAGVSCGAGTVSLTTLVVTNGIVTHC
jgi:hypothetical protein